jgi:hypothetical protein
MRFYIDAEFSERGAHHPIELISIAIVRADGPSYYAVSAEFDPSAVNDWVAANVLGMLGDVEPKGLDVIAAEVAAFVEGGAGGTAPEFWSWLGAYDWVVLCQVFGDMAALPAGWPMRCHDLEDLIEGLGRPEVPSQSVAGIHNALADARHHMVVGEHLEGIAALRAHQRRLWFDREWRSAVAQTVSAGIFAAFDLESRFGTVATVVASHGGAAPIIAGPQHLWFVESGTIREADVGSRAEFECPSDVLHLDLVLDPDELDSWDAEAVIAAAAEDLATQTWTLVAELLRYAPTTAEDRPAGSCLIGGPRAAEVASQHSTARVATSAAFGADDVYAVQAWGLVLASSGLLTTEHLDAEGWHLRGRANVVAVLCEGAAQRLVPSD